MDWTFSGRRCQPQSLTHMHKPSSNRYHITHACMSCCIHFYLSKILALIQGVAVLQEMFLYSGTTVLNIHKSSCIKKRDAILGEICSSARQHLQARSSFKWARLSQCRLATRQINQPCMLIKLLFGCSETDGREYANLCRIYMRCITVILISLSALPLPSLHCFLSLKAATHFKCPLLSLPFFFFF